MPFTTSHHPTSPYNNTTIGYPRLAQLMSLLPPTTIFRRFGALNARVLLYYQSELMLLEKQLKEVEAADRASDQGWKRAYSEDAYMLRSCGIRDEKDGKDGKPRDGDMRQVDLVGRVRGVLGEYNHLLIQQSTILQLKSPHPHDLKYIQHFLANNIIGPLALAGVDSEVWGSTENPEDAYPDLVCLKPRKDADAFSNFLSARAIDWIVECGGKRWMKPDRKYGEVAIADEDVFRLTYWVTSFIAAVFPIVVIAVLDWRGLRSRQPALMAGFNLLLVVLLGVFTQARKIEVFGVVTLFTVAQVVCDARI